MLINVQNRQTCPESCVVATRRQDFEVSAHGDNFLLANKRLVKLMADFFFLDMLWVGKAVVLYILTILNKC